jgi:hypothetical protein
MSSNRSTVVPREISPLDITANRANLTVADLVQARRGYIPLLKNRGKGLSLVFNSNMHNSHFIGPYFALLGHHERV